MPYPWRLIRPLVLAVVVMTLIFPAALYAQDEDTPPVLIQGTPELEQFVGAIRDAYAEVYTEADVQIDPAVGQSGAFDALCSGETDIVMASGAISDDQIAACDRQGQTFIELLLAYEAIVFMAPSATGLTCVSEQLMADSWQLGAAEEISWLDLGATAPDAPVSFYGPNDLSAPYRLFSELVPALALREDIVQTDEVANILDKMREEDSDALGFMSLADYDSIAQPDDVEYLFPLDVEDADGNCIVADLTALEDHTYPLVRTSYLYVNAESAARDDVRSFLQFALGDPLGALTIAPDQGYTTPLPASYEYALNNLSSSVTGRTFSRPLTPVRVDSATMGIVTVAGSSMPFSVVRPVNLSFEQKFVNAEVETNTFGNTSGWAEFCGGFADVLMASREPTADELAVCTDAGIDPYMIDLGYDAVIAAVPSGNDWLECLDGETVLSLLRAGTDEAPAPALWSDLNAEWPESSLLIVTPPNSTGETDFMVFALAQDLTFVMRADVVEDDDPLYRVQGVANTAQDEANPNNGFTYLSWSEFKDSAADVRLVGAGKDCVVPDATTITGGSYPLSYPVRVYFNTGNFDNPLLRAYLWHFFDDESLTTLGQNTFEGLDIGAMMTTQKDAVFTLLADYEEQLAAQQAEDAENADTADDAEMTEDTEDSEETNSADESESGDAADDTEAGDESADEGAFEEDDAATDTTEDAAADAEPTEDSGE